MTLGGGGGGGGGRGGAPWFHKNARNTMFLLILPQAKRNFFLGPNGSGTLKGALCALVILEQFLLFNVY